MGCALKIYLVSETTIQGSSFSHFINVDIIRKIKYNKTLMYIKHLFPIVIRLQSVKRSFFVFVPVCVLCVGRSTPRRVAVVCHAVSEAHICITGVAHIPGLHRCVGYSTLTT